MKIVLILHNSPCTSCGGTELHVLHTARELKKKHDPHIIYRMDNPALSEYSLHRSSLEGIELTGINNTFRDVNRFGDYFINERIDATVHTVLEKAKPDLVHIHHLSGLSLEIPAVAETLSIPTVMTLHDYSLLCPRGQMIRDNLVRCSEIDRMRCTCCLGLGSKRTSPLLRIAGKVFTGLSAGAHASADEVDRFDECVKELEHAVSAFIAPSPFVQEEFIRFGFERNRMHLIPHGIPRFDGLQDHVHTDAKEHSGNGVFTFGYLGSLIPSKGAHLAIDSFRSLTEENIALRIHGQSFPFHGDDGYDVRLRKKAGGDGRITFHGRYDHADLSRILEDIDALIIPSLWNEFFSLVLHEARRCGVPVIASRTGALQDAVRHGVEGFLFTPGDTGELAECMGALLRDEALCRSFVENARQPRTIGEHVTALDGLYRSLRSRSFAQ
jgi:glycosyltransferase involved in cell wall biosynthesis